MSNKLSRLALVVDDDPIIRMDAGDILTDAGFQTQEASNVSEALEMLETMGDDIQLLFTDVQMPGDQNGFDLARKCATRWPHISMVVASGQLSPKADELPKQAAFISKPFSAQVVYDRLQQILPEQQQPEPLKQATST
jgi:CheY-like chemotaxis protein